MFVRALILFRDTDNTFKNFGGFYRDEGAYTESRGLGGGVVTSKRQKY